MFKPADLLETLETKSRDAQIKRQWFAQKNKNKAESQIATVWINVYY